ncbi:hypothetical protein [Qipengyuania marisflavi]|uniref:Uncharacterized protein n=1 Tax=Qipengyuania marisflavi TaxID=2486356 RepID=A0A5S3P6D7_9SPHN|nr:hypothetical protein [Qipengyuania marisflavi]TMM48730.1 hypothetical protein FEV51_04860 [Qipengyuania marisflavi]
MTIIGFLAVVFVIVGPIFLVLSVAQAKWTTYVFTFAGLAILALMVWLMTIFDEDTVIFAFCGIGLIFAAVVWWFQTYDPETSRMRQDYLEKKQREREARRNNW